MAAAQQLPDRAGVPLHALGAGDDEHGIVHHGHRALHLGGEVRVARGVDEKDLVLPHAEHRLIGEYGDAARAFQRMRIQKGVLVVDAAHGAQAARMIEHRLGQRGLARVHVREYAQRDLHRISPMTQECIRRGVPYTFPDCQIPVYFVTRSLLPNLSTITEETLTR